MNSFQISDHCENNVANINVSHCSEDLFQESPQLECNIHNSFTSGTKFSNEISSETSDDACSTPRRKPRRAMSFSHDSSHYYSKKSSDRNDSTTDSSKFFQPISPVRKINSTILLQIDQSSSPEVHRTPGVHHLSKENVAVISFVSESEHSDSSSILDDSLKSEDDQNSKQFFKTPVCSSVKKRTIRQWLNSVSLNCSLKPNENGLHDRHEVVLPESNLSKDKHDAKLIDVNVCISSEDKDNTCDKTFDGKECEALNDLGTTNSCNNDSIQKSNNTGHYCPSLFGSFENSVSDYSRKKQKSCSEHSDVVNDHNTCNDSQKSPGKSESFKQHYKLSKPLERSFHDDSERNISKRGKIFNKRSRNFKSDDDNFSSLNDSDSTFNEICNKNPSKIVDSDDSFDKIRLFKKKKKKNCLNISSDDSEAKDTANDSEDIPHHSNELCTPRRRLYFRNPLNNSLDDDAKPLMISKDDSISSTDNCNEKVIAKTTGLLDQIYSEVHSVSSTSVCSPENQDKCVDDGKDVQSDHASVNETYHLGRGLSCNQPAELNESHDSVSHYQSSSIRHSSPEEQDDVNHINFSGLSIGNTSLKNISENHFDIKINTSDKDGFKSCSGFIDESHTNEDLDSSNQLLNKHDDSSDSIVNIKRKSKKNKLNFSSDDSFLSEKPNDNIIDVNERSDNEANPSIDLTKSDDEYDKYMYRTRSDSSFSDDEEIPGVSKDSSEVLSVHTTTSEEEGDDDGNAPWFDLESYLKKNIPASSKSFDSSFLKNSEKRSARLAKISLPTHSSNPNHTSFLLSLTPEVPDEMCHPEAIKYRKDSFSKFKNELVDLLFKLYNKEIFDGKLPPLEIKWSGHLTTTSGITKSSSKITKNGKIRNSMIKLSKTVVNDASKVRDVLLHELCHAANWLIDEQAGGHGPLFKKWVNKIWIKFPEVPKVKTTHHYELNWKYLYKCSYCGYELGKMKLSLTETSCRLCGGLVTVNT